MIFEEELRMPRRANGKSHMQEMVEPVLRVRGWAESERWRS